MSKLWNISFAKFHGLHNDFLVVRDSHLPRPLATLAKALTDRHTGVGADGLLVLSAPRDLRNHARLRFFNADGSEAEMSGNGIRCAAAFVADTRKRVLALRIETLAGVKTVEQLRNRKSDSPAHWTFRVAMGHPIFEPARIPFRAAMHKLPMVGFPVSVGRKAVRATITSMGNPHCSIFVQNFSSLDWRALGREIERLSVFPRRANVEFIRVISRREIEVRFWERGVGETVSSGTGSCAAAVASILNRKTGRKVRVRTPAGSLEVEWRAGDQVFLVGPAEEIARGNYVYSAPRAR
jgi:diaminopimelate epimerase